MSRALTPLALTLLGLLTQTPMHPYEMRQRLREQGLDRMVKTTHGALYHAVERLAEAGKIAPVETGRAGRRPERTVYAITEAGREAARYRLRELLSTPTPEFPAFRTALALLSLLPPREAAEQLSRRSIALEAELAGGQTAYDGYRKRGLPRIALLEIEHAQAHVRAELDLIRAIAEDIESGRLTWSVDDPCGNQSRER